MLKKILLLAAFAITPLLLSEDASAQCYPGGYGGYGGYYGHHHHRVPVYRVPVHHHHHGHYRSAYRHGGLYGVGYRGIGYGGYGHGIGYGHPYHRGGSVSVRRGGFGLRIGF